MKIPTSLAVSLIAMPLLVSSILTHSGCRDRQKITASASLAQVGDNLCASNMMAVWWLLRQWQGDGIDFPRDLSAVVSTTNSAYFLCPGVAREPGPIAAVNDWTDFIYVGGMSSTDPQVAILLSPPEDHGGNFGIVVWEGGYVSRVTPQEFEKLLKAPWCMATRAQEEGIIGQLKKEVTVQVPRRFRQQYPNAYVKSTKHD